MMDWYLQWELRWVRMKEPYSPTGVKLGEAAGSVAIDTDGPTLGPIEGNMLFDGSTLDRSLDESEIERVVLGSTLGDFDVEGTIWVLWKDSNSYTYTRQYTESNRQIN
jgi:hypothetical protein